MLILRYLGHSINNYFNILHVLCVVDFVAIAAGVVGREGAGLTGAGVAVTVAGVVGTAEDTIAVGAVAVTGVF